MISRRYLISVGEPWNFKGPAGQNLITGKIIKILSDKAVVFESDDILDFEGVKGKVLLLFIRHQGFYLNKENHYTGEVNGGLLLIDYCEDMNEKELEQNSKFVLIGGLEVRPVFSRKVKDIFIALTAFACVHLLISLLGIMGSIKNETYAPNDCISKLTGIDLCYQLQAFKAKSAIVIPLLCIAIIVRVRHRSSRM